MCEEGEVWGWRWLHGNTAHRAVGSGNTPRAYTQGCTHTSTRLFSVLLIEPCLLWAQAGIWAQVTLIPLKGSKLCAVVQKSARTWRTGLYPATWKAVTGSQGPTDGQQDRGKGKLALSADEQEPFVSIAAKPALFINIQSAPEIP